MSELNLRFPIGKFHTPEVITHADLQEYADEIEALTSRIASLLSDRPADVLDDKYRKGSWNIRQVIYHLTDSHLHSYMRFNWTLTENTPTIKAYDEKEWAELPTVNSTPIEIIMDDLKMIQRRLAHTVRSLSEEDMEKRFFHPENGKTYSLKVLSALYAWHSNHHLNHIKIALENPA